MSNKRSTDELDPTPLKRAKEPTDQAQPATFSLIKDKNDNGDAHHNNSTTTSTAITTTTSPDKAATNDAKTSESKQENPFSWLKLSRNYDALNALKGRSKCPKCNQSRKYFCYNCFIPITAPGTVPVVKLPLQTFMYVNKDTLSSYIITILINIQLPSAHATQASSTSSIIANSLFWFCAECITS